MKIADKLIIYFLLTLLSIQTLYSQDIITIDTLDSPDKLILEEFIQGGVSLKNVRYIGSNRAIGKFECKSDSFPIRSGVLLSTGDATAIKGPNLSLGFSGVNNTSGDKTLSSIARGMTWDAAVIEFDFIPGSENIAFDFVFASEEYPEYVNSVFNDVFAFIITRTDSAYFENIAHLPKTREAITVNNVNHLKNTQYYLDNPAPSILYLYKKGLIKDPDKNKHKRGDNYVSENVKCKTFRCELIQFDGFTKMLTAKAKVIPGVTYHFKIAIADVEDHILDSGVLLKAHSFRSYDRYGKIKGDTSGYVVKDDDLLPYIKEEKKISKEDKKEFADPLILFDFDSYELVESEKIEINDFFKTRPLKKEEIVLLKGHTDSKGSYEYNIKLSSKRVIAVKEYLKLIGIPESQININHFGEIKPKTTNETEEGRNNNRRVELSIIKNISKQ